MKREDLGSVVLCSLQPLIRRFCCYMSNNDLNRNENITPSYAVSSYLQITLKLGHYKELQHTPTTINHTPAIKGRAAMINNCAIASAFCLPAPEVWSALMRPVGGIIDICAMSPVILSHLYFFLKNEAYSNIGLLY